MPPSPARKRPSQRRKTTTRDESMFVVEDFHPHPSDAKHDYSEPMGSTNNCREAARMVKKAEAFGRVVEHKPDGTKKTFVAQQYSSGHAMRAGVKNIDPWYGLQSADGKGVNRDHTVPVDPPMRRVPGSRVRIA